MDGEQLGGVEEPVLRELYTLLEMWDEGVEVEAGCLQGRVDVGFGED